MRMIHERAELYFESQVCKKCMHQLKNYRQLREAKRRLNAKGSKFKMSRIEPNIKLAVLIALSKFKDKSINDRKAHTLNRKWL